MYRSNLGAPLCALALCSSAFAQAATPQFALVDLGPTTVAGSGLPWLTVQPTPAPSNFPSTASSQGSACYGVAVNLIYAEYGSEAVGSTCLTTPNPHAARWTSIFSSPTLTDLGVLPGALDSAGDGGPVSAATAFNNVGDVVGSSNTKYFAYNTGFRIAQHAFLYNSGVMTDLGAIAGPNYYSGATSVNDSHEVVGSTNTISNANGSVLNRAFLYTNGTMYNLTFNLVGGPTALLTNALWIDCQGNIAAVGTPASGGSTHSYLLMRQGAARTSCPN
jgi:probable HAF family extracellular repeat protein